jgi:hypothetical protein
MPLTFAPDWKTARPNYVANFGEYQAFLDSMTEDDVKKAVSGAVGKFPPIIDAWMLAVNGGTMNASVEQGSHQTEAPKQGGDGFTLHFTMRVNGKAHHCYLGQNNDGSWLISAVSYKKPNGPGFEVAVRAP